MNDRTWNKNYTIAYLCSWAFVINVKTIQDLALLDFLFGNSPELKEYKKESVCANRHSSDTDILLRNIYH